jgi:nucleoside-diphosphate-sugar epimerase
LRGEDVALNALTDVDCVIHCAASLTGGAAEQQRDTVDATRALLEGMRSSGASRIVSVSSFAVYDVRKLSDGATLDETSPLHSGGPQDEPYVSAKLEQESLIRSTAQAGALQFMILRPGLIYGPGRTWFYELGIRISPRRWLVLAPEARLPVTFVENCAQAMVLAAERGESAATLNLVDDDLPTRREYAAALAAQTDPRPSITAVPWGLLSRSARLATRINRSLLGGRAPLPGLLQADALQTRSKPLEYSNRRAREILGWTPRYGLESGLQLSVEREREVLGE